MDDPRPPRPTGITRPSRFQSRLPIPRSNSVRTSRSKESLTDGIWNPKLRPAPSHEYLASTVDTSAATPPRALSRRPSGYLVASSPRTRANGRSPSQPAAGNPVLGRSLSLRNAPPQYPAPDDFLSDQYGVPELLIMPRETADGEMLDGTTCEAEQSRPKPSLSERTVETLALLPSSPAVKGKSSAFYDSGAARRKPFSRPGSSHQSDGSNRASSRPGSRLGSSSDMDDNAMNLHAPASPYKNTPSAIDGVPGRSRPGVRSVNAPLPPAPPADSVRRSRSGAQQRARSGPTQSRSPSPGRHAREVPPLRPISKTVASRSVNPRPSVNGLFRKPSLPALDGDVSARTPRKISSASQRSSATSCEGTNSSGSSTTTANTALTTETLDAPPTISNRKSSAALREQIAKAKAAKRAMSRQVSSSQPLDGDHLAVIPADTTFDFGLAAFGQPKDDASKSKMLKGRIESARTSGRLNIAALGLKEIPSEVMDMYSLESAGGSGGSWAESVDLTRFVAADNEIEMIGDSIFPDRSQEELAEDEDSQGNIFGGLETLDLHGNVLIALPMGLRRLPMLTSLTLSHNRLGNNCLEVVSQLTSLKDLKLGGNLLYGPLDSSFSNLKNLEILDLHGNNLESLPSSFGDLSRLRILDLSENSFEKLPCDVLSQMPLTELLVRKNQLSGALIADAVGAFPSLQSLDVSANQLTELVSATREEPFAMPSLHQLCVSMNRLQSLPDIGSWSNLVTLSADENNISAVPEGFIALTKLKTVNFSSNDIRVIPPEIGRMEKLTMLRLSGNPLRDKRFCSIGTEEMKVILEARLEPAPAPITGLSGPHTERASAQPHPTSAIRAGDKAADDSCSDTDDFATPPTSRPPSQARSPPRAASDQVWPIRTRGVLDRSHTELSVLDPDACARVAARNAIREVHLHHNLLTTLPDTLSSFAMTLTSLSMSHNHLAGEVYLGNSDEALSLPVLKELNLSSNQITSLVPLPRRLSAPRLQKLDVSHNRITAMPQDSLRGAFPELSVLLMSNNRLADLDPEAIRGLRIVDASNNDIAHLNPRLGLLGGRGGLERLEVGGNRFRVPKWNILERGTEITLRWLRGRVPEAEMAAWRADRGGDGGDSDID